MRLVIADDHPMIVTGIQSVLAGTSYKIVATAPDGVTALDAVEAHKPDVLLLDMQMPKATGIDVLRKLRADRSNLKVVILSANLEDEALVEAIRLGVDGIVLKESAQDVLLKCLDSVVAGKRWIDRELLERALDVTLNAGSPTASIYKQMMPKERALVDLVAKGLRNRDIAETLGITEGTVKVYLHRIYQQVGVSSRTELAIWARDKS